MRLTRDAEGFEVEADPSDIHEVLRALGGVWDRSRSSDDGVSRGPRPDDTLEVECPECGHRGEIPIPNLIGENVDVSPENEPDIPDRD